MNTSVVVVSIIVMALAIACLLLLRSYRLVTRRKDTQLAEILALNQQLSSYAKSLEAKALEQKQAKQQLRSLIDQAPDAIVIVDSELGKFVEEVNPRAEELYALTKEQIIGNVGPADLSPEYQPDGRRSDVAAAAYINAAVDGGNPCFEWTHRNADGKDIPCQVSLSRFPDPSRHLIRASMIDLTERKHEEALRVELEKQLSQSQKLESIGLMTGGMAHDFNNLLTVILGSLELLSHTNEDDASRQLIETAIDAAMQGSKLTSSMVNFARRAELKPEQLSLGDVISDMRTLFSSTIPASVHFDTAISDDLWRVKVDRAGLESALLNIVLNACDAMPGGGQISIRVKNLNIPDDNYSRDSTGLIPGRYVVLTVKDTGYGIDSDAIAKVFDPFYTTKKHSEKSGLGLSSVHGFVIQSGGRVIIDSDTGKGTAVKLIFPSAERGVQERSGSYRDSADERTTNADISKHARNMPITSKSPIKPSYV